MTDELVPNRCRYICPRKQRQCKMSPSTSLSLYCMEHLLFDPDLDEATKESLRIPCPLNPQHSISPHDLQRHIRKCNQRPRILGPFHRPNCNSGLECDNHDDYSTILQDITDEELQAFIIRMEAIHDNFVKEPVGNAQTNFDCYLPHVNVDELGNRSRKHLQQIGSIIASLVQLNLLQANTCFVEMGAGRGQLSHELHACVKQESTVQFVLIERDHQRYRFDAHHRRDHQGPSFERYRLDIRDLYLAELPSIKNSQSEKHTVIISKHLCGGATDLALRCAVDAQRNSQSIQAIIIALCCHHRLLWKDYAGKEFFRRLNLTPKDFSLIRTLTSWGTCENRHRMTQDGKRSTMDGISLQSSTSTSTDRSTYSKQRLFSVEEQENIGLKAKRILDWGRIEYLDENGFSAHLKVYVSKSITLENIALIATSLTN
ncbi:unnamed protein product [Rotaria socialis]|uniref:tRNA:m(4)X modification enzyme TRM13 n=1 Tax=Rotaria socialis TaxID=392032 RepID=A0A818FV61_9BILA|nr:unnamed protein product [Rotaria socialis]CAF4433930.1 unnamed protein product [Rotaria socialis]